MTCDTTTKLQSKNAFLALLAGVGAGVVVGLAIAPKSGKNLRDGIRNTANDYLDSASETAEELRKSAANLAQHGLREVRKAADNAAEKINDTVKGAADAANGAVDTSAAKGHEVIDHATDAVRARRRG
jgi:gas vesicle protein